MRGSKPGPKRFAGWRFLYRTSDPVPGWSWICAHELLAALPGAVILAVPGPDGDALTISPPDGTLDVVDMAATSAAWRAVERAHRAGLP